MEMSRPYIEILSVLKEDPSKGWSQTDVSRALKKKYPKKTWNALELYHSVEAMQIEGLVTAKLIRTFKAKGFSNLRITRKGDEFLWFHRANEKSERCLQVYLTQKDAENALERKKKEEGNLYLVIKTVEVGAVGGKGIRLSPMFIVVEPGDSPNINIEGKILSAKEEESRKRSAKKKKRSFTWRDWLSFVIFSMPKLGRENDNIYSCMVRILILSYQIRLDRW